MPTEPEAFEELIGAIADGHRIDWMRVEDSGRIARKELAAARAIAGLRDLTESPSHGSPLASHGFERIAEIGHGAFGTVWRARDRVLGREVALKVLDNDAGLTPEQRERYLREARALAACEHENIVRIHSVEERGGHLELCLELLEGVTLEQLVKDRGPLSAEEAARIGSDLCRALATLHSHGLLHRDVKPANVMRARGGRIVLLDFGLAHAADPVGRRASTAGGTPLFMAPELLDGTSDFDARVDVYSLGVTLYWLVTANWPYDVTSREELVERMEREPPVPLIDRRPDLPPAFVALVERAMAHDRRDRFASVGAMEAALRAIVETRSRTRNWRIVASVAAAAVVLAAGFIAWGMRPIDPQVVMICRPESDGARQFPEGFHALDKDGELQLWDELMARLTLNRDAHVWGFCADSAGHAFAVFPVPGTILKNPLPAGETVLPGFLNDGDTERGDWWFHKAGVQETYYFFFAREPIAELQALWERSKKIQIARTRNVPAEIPPDLSVAEELHRLTSTHPLSDAKFVRFTYQVQAR